MEQRIEVYSMRARIWQALKVFAFSRTGYHLVKHEDLEGLINLHEQEVSTLQQDIQLSHTTQEQAQGLYEAARLRVNELLQENTTVKLEKQRLFERCQTLEEQLHETTARMQILESEQDRLVILLRSHDISTVASPKKPRARKVKDGN